MKKKEIFCYHATLHATFFFPFLVLFYIRFGCCLLLSFLSTIRLMYSQIALNETETHIFIDSYVHKFGYIWHLSEAWAKQLWIQHKICTYSHRCHNLPSFGLNFLALSTFLHNRTIYGKREKIENEVRKIFFVFCSERKIGETCVHINYVLSSLTLITYNL